MTSLSRDATTRCQIMATAITKDRTQMIQKMSIDKLVHYRVGISRFGSLPIFDPGTYLVYTVPGNRIKPDNFTIWRPRTNYQLTNSRLDQSS